MRLASGNSSYGILLTLMTLTTLLGCGQQDNWGRRVSVDLAEREAERQKEEAAEKESAEPGQLPASPGEAMPLPKSSDESQPSSDVHLVAYEEESEGESNSTIKRPELFAGWGKPEVALFLTGEQHGYIEPCGCTGLTNQKGGLMRRHTLLKQLRDDRGWDVLALDVGNQVRPIWSTSRNQIPNHYPRPTHDGL